jgi:hypothetical protein
LFSQGIVLCAFEFTVDGILDRRDPLMVEVVENARINARPIMHRHDSLPHGTDGW